MVRTICDKAVVLAFLGVFRLCASRRSNHLVDPALTRSDFVGSGLPRGRSSSDCPAMQGGMLTVNMDCIQSGGAPAPLWHEAGSDLRLERGKPPSQNCTLRIPSLLPAAIDVYMVLRWEREKDVGFVVAKVGRRFRREPFPSSF
jgi:hypothetical protein